MDIAIAHPWDYTLPFDDTLQTIADAGFRTISLGADRKHSGYHTPEGKRALDKLLSTHDLRLHNIHAPIEHEPHISSPDEDERNAGIARTVEAIEASRYFNCDAIVLHLSHDPPDSEFQGRLASVRRSFREILAAAEDAGVKIACENVFSKSGNDILRAILDEFAHPLVGLCYDSSHANLLDDPLKFLHDYSDRLFVTHISDNRGREDDHLLPGMGIIDWPLIMRKIGDTDFKGPLMLEVERSSSGYMKKTPVEFTTEAYSKAEWLSGML